MSNDTDELLFTQSYMAFTFAPFVNEFLEVRVLTSLSFMLRPRKTERKCSDSMGPIRSPDCFRHFNILIHLISIVLTTIYY